MTRLSRAALIALVFLVAGELAVRSLFDIKLYGADAEVGYWSLPGQSGGSLLTGSYAFNSDGFGVSQEYAPSAPTDILLVGDSVVAGTPAIDQDERLGVVLERQTGWQVWPLATGSWALANQIRAVQRIDLRGIEAIVIVLNSQDFQAPSHWPSEYDFPRAQPASHLVYAIQKALPFLRGAGNPIPVRKGNLVAEWSEFRASVDMPIVIVGYERKGTTGSRCDWLPDWIGPASLCIDLMAMGHEDDMLDGVHPDARGNEVIAASIAAHLGAAPDVANDR